jgi:hypothetical protein
MTEGAAMANGVQANRLECRLPDGGHVEVTDQTVVPMGDVHAYRQLTYRHPGDKRRPPCKIVFEVRDGVPICASFTLTADDRTPIRGQDLRSFKLDGLRADVYSYAGVFVLAEEGDLTFHPKSRGKWVLTVGYGIKERQHVEQATRRRRMTPELLSKVAKIHKSAPEGSSMDAIAAAFGVSERQAWRYIAQARENGLIK